MTETRDRIADSFESHLDRFGFRKTSMEDIAKDLRISKKTIYVHFESKDEIYKYVLERRAERVRSQIADDLAGRSSCWEKIEGLIGVTFSYTRTWWENNRGSELVEKRYQLGEQAFFDAYTKLLSEYVHSGTAGGEFTVEDPEVTSHLVSGLILAGLRMVRDGAREDVERAVVAAAHRLLTC